MSLSQVPLDTQKKRARLDKHFSSGDLVKVYESRYKRTLFASQEDRYLMGIVLNNMDNTHYYRVLLFVKHYDTGERTVITHFKNIEVYKDS